MLDTPHLIAFLKVPNAEAENAVADYARSYFTSHPRALLSPEATSGMAGMRPATPSFLDREATLNAMPPDAAARLKVLERQLLGRVSKVWHVPPGETVVQSSVEVLAEPYDECPVGAVAVVRQTDKATVAFLLTHMRVDPATGDTSHVDSTVSGATIPSPIKHPTKAMVAAASGGSDYAGMALDTASTLAFALPEPWGVIGSAAINLFHMFLPAEKSSVVDDVVSGLGTYMKQSELNHWVQGAHSLMQWCQEQLAAMKSVDPPKSLVRDTMLPDLEKNLAPGGTSLYDSLTEIRSKEYINEKGAFDVLLVCVSTYFFGLKFKLLLDAYVASQADKEGNQDEFIEWNNRWRYDYVLFEEAVLGSKGEITIPGWAPTVSQIINSRIAHRMGQITPLVREDHTGVGFCSGSGKCATTHSYGWAWRDTETNESHWYPDTEEGHTPHTYMAEHRDEAERERNAHIAEVSNNPKWNYSKATQTVQKWRDSINEWNEHLPPGKPKGSPRIDPKSWQGDAPKDSKWAQYGNGKVSYAVAFYNEKGVGKAAGGKGPGLLSEWSAAVDINGKAHPTITDVPTDDLQMATGRRIYRRFDGEKAALIGLIPDNKTTTYTDNKN